MCCDLTDVQSLLYLSAVLKPSSSSLLDIYLFFRETKNTTRLIISPPLKVFSVSEMNLMIFSVSPPSGADLHLSSPPPSPRFLLFKSSTVSPFLPLRLLSVQRLEMIFSFR